MCTHTEDTEISLLNAVVFPALKGLVISSHVSNDQTIIFMAYRQTTSALATYLKLSSIFKINNPIDCHVLDTVKDKFRFTVIYNIQSFSNNTRVQIVTRTNEVLPLVSLQALYPAFN